MAKKIKKGVVKELFDLEIDEVSAVDSPAIGESFYITKSVNKNKPKKGADMSKPVTKSGAWNGAVKKSEGECTHCVFCGITKEEESEQMGMGLIKNVCFECAVQHHEKGVFDSVLDGTFSTETFKESYPDIELIIEVPTAKSEDGKSGDEDEAGSEDDAGEAGSKDGEEDEAGSEGDSDEDADSDEDEDGENDSEKSANSEDKDNKGENAGQESDSVKALEKRIEDVEGMLERTLELHDVAAQSLNEIVALTFASLDAVMAVAEERLAESEDQKSKDLFNEINESIKSVREDVTKAGAKISGKRMAVLREISEKLTSLITSVMGQEAVKGLSKSHVDLQKSLDEMKSSFQEEIKEVKEDYETQLKEVNTKLEEVEQAGGGSFDLGDEDESTHVEDESDPQQKSVFAGLVDVKEIQKQVDRKKRNLK